MCPLVPRASSSQGADPTSASATQPCEDGRTRELRSTGIGVLGELPWGAHICAFYETPQDLLDSAISYFAAGLRANEYCFWAAAAPIAQEELHAALDKAVPSFAQCREAGQIDIVDGNSWYLSDDGFDMEKVISAWEARCDAALKRGYDGMRAIGNPFWNEFSYWDAFVEYEGELDRALTGQKMLVLCAYPLTTSTAVNVMEVTRAHKFVLARRGGTWEFLQTPELVQARTEFERQSGAPDILSRPFPRSELLTPRERAALAHIVRGASAKAAARTLGVSPRTIEFHRANIMRKIGARNTADLVRIVLGAA